MQKALQQYIWNLFLLADCTIDSVLFFSSPFETISSRVWRYKDKNKVAAGAVKAIDWLALKAFGQADHCKESEQRREFYEGYEILK